MPSRSPLLTATSLCAAALVAGTLSSTSACSSAPINDYQSTLTKSTTKIASAGVVGNSRRPDALCGPAAPMDSSGVSQNLRVVTHSVGSTAVPADPQRIVVLDTSALDAACALGLQDRVVGAATSDTTKTNPRYLGSAINAIPTVGSTSAPDINQIARLHPDVILGSTKTSESYGILSAIAPTVSTPSTAPWRSNFLTQAQALGRLETAREALATYDNDARQASLDLSAPQTQASVIWFFSEDTLIAGPGSFAGQILTDLGVQRPPPQRLGEPAKEAAPLEQYNDAEGDLIYVSFAGDAARERGTKVLKSSEWKDLSAVKASRIFVVNEEIWITAIGITAARAILADLRESLNASA
ncbi:MAG: ABC transporter substrate-binding protein [Mycobacteriaceae bacterium]